MGTFSRYSCVSQSFVFECCQRPDILLRALDENKDVFNLESLILASEAQEPIEEKVEVKEMEGTKEAVQVAPPTAAATLESHSITNRASI